jgi:putative ABC transport system ATP-binding protein
MNDGARPAISLSSVVRHYDGGRIRAVDGVDLEIARGEWVSLSGPSGCGKSTLLHLIAGLDHPSSGAIVVNGRDVTRNGSLDDFRRKTLGLVFQFHYLLPNFTSLQNVVLAMFGSGRSRAEQRERARQLLEEVGLPGKEGQLPNTLSGGERQRVAIARALANDPPILLADEPTGALDVAATDVILDLFRRIHRDHGVTILLVTHDPRVAAASDRQVFMREGRFVPAAEHHAPPP